MPKFSLAQLVLLVVCLLGLVENASAVTYGSVKDDLSELRSDTAQYVQPWLLRRALTERVDYAYRHVDHADTYYQQSKRKPARRALKKSMRALNGYRRLLHRAVRWGKVSYSVAHPLEQQAKAILAALKDLKHERFGENDPPTANAGPDQSVELNALVTLDGSASSDPNGQSLTYQWDVVDPGGNIVFLDNADSPNPTFSVDAPGEHIVTLVVNDGELDSEPDTAIISTLNVAPLADAGGELSGAVGDTVQFDGSNSSDVDGDELTFSWSLVERPSESLAELIDPTTANPTLTMDAPGEYWVALIVNDGELDSAPDQTRSSTVNSPPVANAGVDQAVPLSTFVQLDGSASSDIDGDLLQFRWSILSAPEGSQAQLDDASAVKPTIQLDAAGDYLIQLVVNDGVTDSAPDTVGLATLNSRPVADAGEDQTAPVGSVIYLAGDSSSDADGDPLDYRWSFTSVPSGSAASLQGANSENPSFQIDVPGTYTVQLIVGDGELDSAPDTVVVSTVNSRPVAHAGADQTVFEGALVTLDGSGSYDVDNDALLYRWGLLSAPATSVAEIVNGAEEVALLQVDAAGSYLVQLIVNDGEFDSEPDSAVLTVQVLPNRAPVISSTPVTSASVNALYQYQVSAADPDGDALEFRLEQAPAGMGIDQSGLITWVPGAEGAETIEVVVADPDGLEDLQGFVVTVAAGDGLPPNPEWVASEIKPTELTSIGEQIRFIYEGDVPLQTDVDPTIFEVQRTSVLKGIVKSRDNTPLPGVRVTHLTETRYGKTLTRADGQYDFVVNGGGSVVLEFSKPGYLSAQRRVGVPWNGYVNLDDIVLVPLDSAVTSVDLSNTAQPYQVAQGSVSNDEDGQRQATILFPANTTATLTLPDGLQQPLTTLNVRATEYTVGPNGLQSMPGELPSTSGYTYAVELSVDEAIAADATRVDFSQPLPVYVDNFLNFPVGEIVPLGWYDRERAIWVPADNGRIIKVLSIVDGAAVLDVNGDDVADGDTELLGLGITPAEQVEMATQLLAGNTYWRVQVDHFTPWDCNWPFGPPQDAEPPTTEPPVTESDDQKPDEEPECPGCTILAESQTLGEDIDLVGTPFSLHYRSDRVPGNKVGRTLRIPLSDDSVPASLKRIDLTIEVAGQHHRRSFDPSANLSYEFTWDGKDAYGRYTSGAHTASVAVDYVYSLVYYAASSDFDRAFASLTVSPSNGTGGAGGAVERGATVIGTRGTQDVEVRRNWETQLTGRVLPNTQLGGFGLNAHHSLDPVSGWVWYGDGSRRDVGASLAQLTSIEALNVAVGLDIAVDEEGSIYYLHWDNDLLPEIRKINLDGGSEVVLPEATWSRYLTVFALGQDGNLYITGSDSTRSNAELWRLNLSTGQTTKLSDSLGGEYGLGIAVSPDGVVYVALYNGDVKSILPSGEVSLFTSVDTFGWVRVFVGPDGSVYVSDTESGVDVYRPDGAKQHIPLLGVFDITWDEQGNHYFAVAGDLVFESVVDSGVYYGNDFDNIVRISGFVDFYGDDPWSLSDLNDGLYLSDAILSPIGLKYSTARNGLVAYSLDDILSIDFNGKAGLGDLTSTNASGSELYQFDVITRRHVATVDTRTGAVLYDFRYDNEGRLVQVIDVDGEATVVAHDAQAITFTAPEGQQTTLELDANGWASRIVHPDGAADEFVIDAEGLLTEYRDARGNPRVYQYDSFGRLTSDSWPNGGGWTLSRSDDEAGVTVAMQSGEGRVSQFALSSDGRQFVRTITAQNGAVTQTTDSGDGRIVTSRADGSIIETREAPDQRFGWKAPIVASETIRLPSGLTSNYTLNQEVVLEDPTDPLSLISTTETRQTNGRTQTRTYDAATRTWTTTSPEGRVSTVTLDAKYRPVTVAVQGLEPISLAYDPKGRLESMVTGVDAEQRITSFAYHGPQMGNQAGYLADISDAEARHTGFGYDDAGRVVQQTLADLRTIDFRYDANGNLIELTPPGKPLHAFIFDSMDDESHYIPPATIDIVVPTTRYNYDKDRKLTSIARPDGRTATLQYHAAKGQLETLSIPRGDYSYTYDPVSGQLSSVMAPDGGILSYSYDGSLLQSTTWAGEVSGEVHRRYNNDFVVDERCLQAEAHCIEFGYDGDLVLTQAGALSMTRDAQRAGLLNGSVLGTIASTYTYNGFGELEAATTSNDPLGDQLYSVSYVRDKLGRIVQKTETVEGVSHVYGYVYDLAGRLESVTMDGIVLESYGYDGNGNRIELDGASIATYDEQDRLLTYGAYQYTYTENGELTERTDGVNTSSYQYDMLGNLVSVTLPNGELVEYIIDGQNRRIGKKINGALVQGFLYKDQLNPIAELDGLGRVVRRFVYADKNNIPAYMAEVDPDTQAVIATYRIVSDHLGSPRLVVEVDTGAVMQRMDFDPWGNVLADSNPGFQPFGFAGGIYDQQVGLIRHGKRDYDPGLGRWMSKDSIGFLGGDANLYAYVLGDPINWFDPEGTRVRPSGNGSSGNPRPTGSNFTGRPGSWHRGNFYPSIGAPWRPRQQWEKFSIADLLPSPGQWWELYDGMEFDNGCKLVCGGSGSSGKKSAVGFCPIPIDNNEMPEMSPCRLVCDGN